MLFSSLADIQPFTNTLCGMTIICCFFADFDDRKVDRCIVVVLEAGLPPAVVLSISVVIVNK